MSTRGAVVTPWGDSWRGRYVHWGADLAPALRAILLRDGYSEAAGVLTLRYFGWSEVTGDAAPELRGVHDERFTAVPGYGIAYTEARGQSAPGDWVTPDNWGDYGVELVYLLTPDGVAVWDPATGERRGKFPATRGNRNGKAPGPGVDSHTLDL